MYELKLTRVGDSVGAIFPEEVLARLNAANGDTLFVIETPDGLLLTTYDPQQEEELAAGRAFMAEYRDTFHQLAK